MNGLDWAAGMAGIAAAVRSSRRVREWRMEEKAPSRL
jgi:hypothetical protein